MASCITSVYPMRHVVTYRGQIVVVTEKSTQFAALSTDGQLSWIKGATQNFGGITADISPEGKVVIANDKAGSIYKSFIIIGQNRTLGTGPASREIPTNEAESHQERVCQVAFASNTALLTLGKEGTIRQWKLNKDHLVGDLTCTGFLKRVGHVRGIIPSTSFYSRAGSGCLTVGYDDGTWSNQTLPLDKNMEKFRQPWKETYSHQFTEEQALLAILKVKKMQLERFREIDLEEDFLSIHITSVNNMYFAIALEADMKECSGHRGKLIAKKVPNHGEPGEKMCQRVE
uniref:WD_REPEATS_REGION domain-containing protein n=1 Tax=Panagrellus redivivus TaxID=6233 RepID=A0A7E4WDX7_PANRE